MDFSAKGFEQLASFSKQFPKQCSCGRAYTQRAWSKLPGKKLWKLPWGEVQELRDCVCKSTMNVVVVPELNPGTEELSGIEGLNDGIRLKYFPINLVYGFTFGDGLLRLNNERMFYESRDEAVEAAKRHDLVVEKSGKVRVAHHGAMNGLGGQDDYCFACGRRLGKKPHLADTRDAQKVFVGSECYKKILAAGDAGWQPERGPRLFPVKD
jgi:hypothetical protein